jgi:hypothetical protein
MHKAWIVVGRAEVVTQEAVIQNSLLRNYKILEWEDRSIPIKTEYRIKDIASFSKSQKCRRDTLKKL